MHHFQNQFCTLLFYLRLEHVEVPNLGEDNFGEAGIPNFLSNVSVPHQFHTEERRMELVKVNRCFYFIFPN
jgi:hypothetical protein